MASTSYTSAPPTETDVHRGAEVLAGFDGVWRVAVFGSVSRGEADEWSDIDYLVICDEIDYETRNQLALGMQAAAFTATGCSVDVVVSDTAEWAARTALQSTLEARVEHEAVNLVLKRRKHISKGRQTITMATKAEQATAELVRMTRSLNWMEHAATAVRAENEIRAPGRDDLVDAEREARWLKTLQEAEMALEHGLSALIHVTGGKREGRISHELTQFRDALPEGPVRDQVVKILNPLRVSQLSVEGDLEQEPDQKEFTVFRIVADYGARTIHDAYVTADRVAAYLTATMSIGELALRETAPLQRPAHFAHQATESLDRFEVRLKTTSQFVNGYEPLSGRSTPTPSLPPPD